MTRHSSTLSVIVVFLALGISSPAPAATPFGNWRLRHMVERGRKIPLVSGSLITLRIHRNNRCSGNAGVNNYFGNSRISERNGRIQFPGPFGSTRILGPPDWMEQERRYLQNLEKSERFAMRKRKKLRLLSGDRKTKLVFRR